MHQAVERRKISGIQICRKAPTITHLLFADDSIFFIKADKDEVCSLKDVLSQYEEASGHRVNFEKSEVCFSHNTPAKVRREVCNILRMHQVACHSKYLGLPLLVGQRKTETFKYIIEKTWRKVKDWKSKLLSAAGREVLVKAVIQAIPVYMMSVYQFPRKVISELSKLIQQFWWVKKGNKGISWLNQSILQKKKCEGGLGFKDLNIFNEAILMKIAWRMVKYPQLLLSKLLLAKYCGGENIINARLGSNPSHIWRGIMRNMHVFLGNTWWEEDGDTYRWRLTSYWVFSVKSAYDVLKDSRKDGRAKMGEQSDGREVHKFWKRIWGCKVPNKVKVFCWRLFHNSLPDAWNLRRRGVLLDSRCKLCGCRDETALHVVRDCWWAHVVYRELGLEPSSLVRPGFDPADWIWSCFASCSKEDCRTLLVAAWVCWKNRNRVWHGLDSWCAKYAGIVGRSLMTLSGSLFCPRPWENASLNDGWSPPDVDCIKINSDGSWNGITKQASIGIVARDHLGMVLWAWADQEDHCFCAGEVEGRALLRGLEKANEYKASKVIFEVDSVEVCKAVSNGKGVGDWCFSWLLPSLNLLQSNPGWSVHFISREANQVADCLASKANAKMWKWKCLDAIPLCIDSVL